MDVQLYNGDCLAVMPWLPDGCADMILCDLPYGTTACKWDTIIPFEPLWEQYKRLIKPNGAIVLFGSEPFSSNLRLSNLKWYRYDWVWEKSNSTGFQLANKRPLKKHENISVFYKNLPSYNPQGVVKYDRKNRRSYVGENWAEMKANCYIQKYTNYPTSILRFSYDKEKVHPTQKPVALLEYLIRTYTNEGETVLDNTMGSGSTGVACMNTGRNFIGIELDPGYFETAKNRIETAKRENASYAENSVEKVEN